MDAVDHVSVSFQDSGSIDPVDVVENGSALEAPLEPSEGDAVGVSDAETLDVPSQPDSVQSSASSDTVPSPIPDLTPSLPVPRPRPRRIVRRPAY